MKPAAVEHLDLAVARGLSLVERLIRLDIARLRVAGVPAGRDEYRGLYITDEEVDQLLGAPAAKQDAAAEAVLEAQLAQARKELNEIAHTTLGPLGRLIALAGLHSFEVGCLLIGLALEADLRFDRPFAYAQDDVTKRRPRVELALRLLLPAADRLSARSYLTADAPLRRLRLMTLHTEAGQPYTPLPAQTLALDARVAGFLLGQAALDEALKGTAELLCTTDASLSLPESLAQRLADLGRLPATALESPVILLNGRAGAVRDAARVLSDGAGLAVLAVDFVALVAVHGLDAALTLAEREAALLPAALLLQDVSRLKPDDAAQLKRRLDARPLAPLLLLGADGDLAWSGLTITLPASDFEARRALWSRQLSEFDPVLAGSADGLAGKFQLNASQIADAVQAARASALWRSPARPVVTAKDLYAAARAQSAPTLSSLAHNIVPRFSWDDIVLRSDQLQQLREMGNYVEHHHTVGARRARAGVLASAPPAPPPAGEPAEPAATPGVPENYSTYLRYLPPIYSVDDFMGRFLLIFETILSPIERTVTNLNYYFAAQMTPPKMLPWLASWLGLALGERWPDEQRRALILAVVDLYQWRGTRRGLSEFVRLYTGLMPDIIESGVGRRDATQADAFRFVVRIKVPDPAQVDRAMIETIIEAEKPAHTGYSLEIVAA